MDDPPCPHVCCTVPYDRDHLHLFGPDDCVDCRGLELAASQRRHPTSRAQRELEP